MKFIQICLFILTFCFYDSSQYDYFYTDTVRHTYVIDNLLSSENMKQLRNYVMEEPLRFNGISNIKFHKSGFQTRYFSAVPKNAFVALRKFVADLLNMKDKDLKIQSFAGKIFDTSDFIPTQTCIEAGSSYIFYVILSDNIHKNSYGDFAIYDINGEIIQSFQPKFGRSFLLQCNSTNHKFWPPSLEKEKRLTLFAVEFGFSKIHHVKYRPKRLSGFLKNQLSKETYKNHFQTIDPEKYLVRKLITKNQKRIYIFDNIFSQSVVELIYEYIVKYATYYAEEIDLGSEDNVRWIIGLDEPTFHEGLIWSLLKQVITYISGIDTYTPYDVSVNHIRRTDSTTIHKDCSNNEKELTSLLYVNPDWNDLLYGETIYLDGDDFITSVVPKFGRLVVFDGDIDHSARPPSPDFHGARYTLAVKSAINKEAAQKRKRDMHTF